MVGKFIKQIGPASRNPCAHRSPLVDSAVFVRSLCAPQAHTLSFHERKTEPPPCDQPLRYPADIAATPLPRPPPACALPPPTPLPHPCCPQCPVPSAAAAPSLPLPLSCPALPTAPGYATKATWRSCPAPRHSRQLCMLPPVAQPCASTTSTARPSAVLLSAAIQPKPRKGAPTAVHGISAIYTSIRSPGSTHLQHRRLDPTWGKATLKLPGAQAPG